MQPIRARFGALTDSHPRVRANHEECHYEEAVLVSTGVQRDASIALDDALRVEVARARMDLDDHADDAREGFDLLIAIAIVFTLLASMLVVVGLQPRIQEYR
jgi:hypothetical protein